MKLEVCSWMFRGFFRGRGQKRLWLGWLCERAVFVAFRFGLSENIDFTVISYALLVGNTVSNIPIKVL